MVVCSIGFTPLEPEQVIPVMRAMQGHSESSRLWEKHIDRIIRKYDFQPTVHEPCLYSGVIDGERCIFKRQVDDFALATAKAETAHKFFDMIDDELTMPMKGMGLVTLFNAVWMYCNQNTSSNCCVKLTSRKCLPNTS
jgi:hypothetical protein